MKSTGTVSRSSESVFSGLQLVLVQSIVCLAVLLIAVVLKIVGGSVYERAVTQFQEGVYESHLLAPSSTTQNETTTASTTETVSTSVMNATAVSTDNMNISPPLTDGVITSPFGQRTDPVNGTPYSQHHGVDIAAAQGTPLYALMDGTVTEVGYEENGYGWYVVVQCTSQHQYVYAHCDSVLTTVNQRITSGEVVALVGSTGKSTGNHLHFEWRENGKAVDPMIVLPKETYA